MYSRAAVDLSFENGDEVVVRLSSGDRTRRSCCHNPQPTGRYFDGACSPNRQSPLVPMNSIFLPKSIRRDWNHQKQPDCRQQRLNRLPLPQGHGSLRPSFSSSNLLPCTMRVPRLTFVSEGKPRRRLLIGSKKGIFEMDVAHD